MHEPERAPHLQSRKRFVSCAWLSAFLLAWWYIVGPGLTGPAAEALLTKPISAWCLFILAMAGVLRASQPDARPGMVVTVASSLVAVAAFSSLVANIVGYAVSDMLKPYLQPSPLTALGLLAGSVAVSAPRTHRGLVVQQAASLVVTALGLATVMAYLFGSPLPAGVMRGPIDAALPSGAALVLLGLGGILDEPNRGFLRYLAGNLPSQRATRNLAIATVTIPFMGGWVGLLLIRSGLTSPSLGVAFVVTMTFTVWGAMVWWTGRELTGLQLKELAMQQELKDKVLARTLDLELAMRELDAFNYSVSHDLRGPTRTLRMQLQILREDHGAEMDKAAKSLIDDMERISLDLQQKLAALSELARAGTSEVKRTPIDASGLVEEIVGRLQAAEPGRKVELKVEPSVVVEADKVLFAIMMENLLGNAWKFTRDVRPAVIEFGRETFNSRRMYFVRDNGVGFEAADARTLFRPFRRLHPGFEGTGIGLATVARIVRRHGGTIEAEGTPGRGAVFRFTLGKADAFADRPRPPEEAASPVATPQAAPGSLPV